MSNLTPQPGQTLQAANLAADSVRLKSQTMTVSASDVADSAKIEIKELLAVKRSLANAQQVIERMVGERRQLIERLLGSL